MPPPYATASAIPTVGDGAPLPARSTTTTRPQPLTTNSATAVSAAVVRTNGWAANHRTPSRMAAHGRSAAEPGTRGACSGVRTRAAAAPATTNDTAWPAKGSAAPRP